MNWLIPMFSVSFSVYWTFAFLIHYLSLSSIESSSIRFTVTRWGPCLEPRKEFLTLHGISVEQCVFECAMRSDCGSLGYISNGRLNICEIQLNGSLYLNLTDGAGTCMFIRREDMDLKEVETLCTCSNGRACASYSGQCLFTECKHLTVDNGYVFGNIRYLNARVRIRCNDGYMESNGVVESTCKADGNWSYTPTCVLRSLISAPATATTPANEVITTSLTQATTIIATTQNKETTQSEATITTEATTVETERTTEATSTEATAELTTSETTTVKSTKIEAASAEATTTTKQTTPAEVIVTTEETSTEAETATEATSIEVTTELTTSETTTTEETTPTEAKVTTEESKTYAATSEATSMEIKTTSTTEDGKMETKTIEDTTIESLKTTRTEVATTEGTTTEATRTLKATTITEVATTGHALNSAETVCPSVSGDWIHPTFDQTFEVSISKTSVKQSGATTACTGLASSLVKIDMEWKQIFLADSLSNCTGYSTICYWIDGSKVGSSWQFSDSSAMPTDNTVFWDTGEPTTTGGVGCVAINTIQRWSAKNCNNKCGYICELTK